MSQRAAVVTDEDRRVMKALLDQTIRPRRNGMIQRGLRMSDSANKVDQERYLRSARFLVFDSTIASCEPGAVFGLRACIDAATLDELDSLPPLFGLVFVKGWFRERNAKSLPIAGTIGDDVIYIPATVETRALQELRLRHWPSEVIKFSVPTYVGTAAVIFYSQLESHRGFVSRTA